MELRHIRYFIAVAEELHFGRAAEKLNISTPPLSRQIRELEEELGTQLFIRTKRHVELTEAGKTFLQKAVQIIDQVEQASVLTKMMSSGQSGELVIGYSGTIYELLPAIKQFRKQYTTVGLILQKLHRHEMSKTLRDHKIDLAMMYYPVGQEHLPSWNQETFEMMKLNKIQFYAAVPNSHPLAAKNSIASIRELANETFIMSSRTVEPIYIDIFQSLFQQTGFTPQSIIHINDYHTIYALVSEGLGVTLSHSSFYELHGVTILPIDDFMFQMDAIMIWNDSHASEHLRAFLQIVKNIKRSS